MLKNYIDSCANEVTFYRDSFRRFIYIGIGLLVIDMLLLLILYYKVLTVTPPPDFATTSDGRLIRIEPE